MAAAVARTQRDLGPIDIAVNCAGWDELKPFVQVGSAVGPDTPVCIIEAMKIFNEIKAECSGVIEKVLIKNGEPVEFGQPLFRVRPG